MVIGMLGLTACQAKLVDSSGAMGPGGTTGATTPTSDAAPGDSSSPDRALDAIEETSPGDAELSCEENKTFADNPLLKLSTVQYKNTVRDLLRSFGLDSLLEGVEPLLASIPDDSLGDSFRGLDDRVAVEHVQGFLNVGAFIGDAVLEETALLNQVAGACAEQERLSETCWDEFLSGFLQAVHRRPLLGTEKDLYRALDDGTRSGPEVIRAALVVALSSPRFLYHVETQGTSVDNREDLFQLDGYELASRLSYTFWQTMPDAELFAAAQDGSLLSETGYRQQLERIWADPRTEATLEQFWTEWLKLEKFTGFETSRPAFQALTEGESFGQEGHDYYADMVREVQDLTRIFTFEKSGTLTDLLTTNLSVTPSTDLASLYGVDPWDGEGDFPTLNDRSGLLQRAALLVSNLEQTNPFHRGASIRRRILCDSLPQPDPNELPPGSLDPPPVDEAQTTRQRFEAKVEDNGLCEGCHASFSNIGYVLESYDAVGRFRTTEMVYDEESGELLAELPIDTVAQVNIASSDEEAVEDAAEMNRLIAESGKVEACLAENYFAYFSRRAHAATSLDGCIVEDLSATLSNKEGGLAAAFKRLARVPTFFTRKVGDQ